MVANTVFITNTNINMKDGINGNTMHQYDALHSNKSRMARSEFSNEFFVFREIKLWRKSSF